MRIFRDLVRALFKNREGAPLRFPDTGLNQREYTMVTVIDMTTGKIVCRSRSAEPVPMTASRETSARPQTALQTFQEDSENLRASMPPELANVCVDVLLTRWRK